MITGNNESRLESWCIRAWRESTRTRIFHAWLIRYESKTDCTCTDIYLSSMYRRYVSYWFHENEYAFSSRKLFHRSVQGDSHPIFRVRFEGLSGDKLSLDFPCLVAQVMRVPPRFRVDPNLPSKGHTTLFPQGWRIYGRGGVRPRGRKMRRHCLRWKFCAMGVVRHGSPRVFTTIGSEISRCEWGAGIW